MRRGFRALSVLVVLSGFALPSASRAGDLVVGNLDQPPSLFSPNTITTTDYVAQQFTTGATATTLDVVFASLGNFISGNNGDFQLLAWLAEDNSNAPGTTLLSLNQVGSIPTSGFVPSGQGVEFDPASSGFVLAANTSYWFVLAGTSRDGSGSVDWQWTDSTSHIGPGSLPMFGLSADSGSTWSTGANTPFLIQVNRGQLAIPEPSSCVLACTACAGLSFASFRRRGRRQV